MSRGGQSTFPLTRSQASHHSCVQPQHAIACTVPWCSRSCYQACNALKSVWAACAINTDTLQHTINAAAVGQIYSHAPPHGKYTPGALLPWSPLKQLSVSKALTRAAVPHLCLCYPRCRRTGCYLHLVRPGPSRCCGCGALCWCGCCCRLRFTQHHLANDHHVKVGGSFPLAINDASWAVPAADDGLRHAAQVAGLQAAQHRGRTEKLHQGIDLSGWMRLRAMSSTCC
jgi:hypothetical protein